ncbi:MAG: peptidoglycan editing factor PgeF [Pseudomonadota bacterium]
MKQHMITSALLGPWKHIKYGFFTRQGGVSKGLWQGANMGLGSKDNLKDVKTNRKILAQLFDASIITLYQTHSNDVIEIGKHQQDPLSIKADGMICCQSQFALGILTADCAPVLFYDPVCRVIGAAHAGWKGALSGIVENCLKKMYLKGSKQSDIKVVVGPHIRPQSYEVGAEMVEIFAKHHQQVDLFFNQKNDDKYYFDLGGYIVWRLRQAGISQIDLLDVDTYSDSKNFFSYRRSTHLGEHDYGRQISIIMLA